MIDQEVSINVFIIGYLFPFSNLKEGKTALYWGVDKGHNDIVKQLLALDPDLEICNKVSFFSSFNWENISNILLRDTYYEYQNKKKLM